MKFAAGEYSDRLLGFRRFFALLRMTTLACLVIFVGFEKCSFAQETILESQKNSEEVETPKTLHEALDRRYRYSKRLQSEISVFGGDYVGDEWYNTWDVGARYYLHLNNSFAAGAVYRYSPIRTDSSGAFGQSLKTKSTHTVDGEVMYSNDCAFRGGNTVVECDLFLTAGVGAIEINNIWGAAGVFGGGMKIYTPAPFFAVRFDVDTILHNTPKPGGNSFNSDIVMELGVSFLFPVRRINQSAGL